MTNRKDGEGQQTPGGGRAEDDAGPVQSQCQVLWDTVTVPFTSSPDGLQTLCASLDRRSVVRVHGHPWQVTPRVPGYKDSSTSSPR